jgi:hypothetical protein
VGAPSEQKLLSFTLPFAKIGLNLTLELPNVKQKTKVVLHFNPKSSTIFSSTAVVFWQWCLNVEFNFQPAYMQ